MKCASVLSQGSRIYHSNRMTNLSLFAFLVINPIPQAWVLCYGYHPCWNRLNLTYMKYFVQILTNFSEERKCGVPLTKMCDLINDCGDWSDEDMQYCLNNFECKTNDTDGTVTRVIALSKTCNGEFKN